MADHLLLLRFRAGSLVAADVVPPSIVVDFDNITPDHSVRSVVRVLLYYCDCC